MKARANVLAISGLVLLGAAVAHLLGWAQFDGTLEAVDPPVVGALRVGWIWGSVGFVTIGVVVLAAALGWRRSGRDPRPVAGPVALALVAFGLWAWISRDFNSHFLGFVAFGALVGAPLLGAMPRS